MYSFGMFGSCLLKMFFSPINLRTEPTVYKGQLLAKVSSSPRKAHSIGMYCMQAGMASSL